MTDNPKPFGFGVSITSKEFIDAYVPGLPPGKHLPILHDQTPVQRRFGDPLDEIWWQGRTGWTILATSPRSTPIHAMTDWMWSDPSATLRVVPGLTDKPGRGRVAKGKPRYASLRTGAINSPNRLKKGLSDDRI
ncbi:hypothetical protein [Primorskyibacter sp. S87]|uniref:hypothetical protein n=1 Tax=Primorskyibacter sp. S87 TaxID=3415126 RepID=UPI003C7DAE14